MPQPLPEIPKELLELKQKKTIKNDNWLKKSIRFVFTTTFRVASYSLLAMLLYKPVYCILNDVDYHESIQFCWNNNMDVGDHMFNGMWMAIGVTVWILLIVFTLCRIGAYAYGNK